MQTRSLYGRRRLSPLSVAPVQFSVAPVIPGRPHIDNAYDTWGLPRILTALEHGHGTEFVDAAQTLSALRKPFSEVQYSVIAPMFGLPPKPSIQFEGFDELTILSTMLPMSVVGKLVTRTIEAFATPGSIPELRNEAATGLFLPGTFQTLLGLFGGILRDKPDRPLPSTDLNSGGKLEGGVFCSREMFFVVRELKPRLGQKDFLDSVAQVMCELFAVWHVNKRANSDVVKDKLVPVTASLCDGTHTHYLCYNGLRFSSRSIRGSTSPRNGLDDVETYVEKSLPMLEYTFALLLEGYYKTLELCHERSVRRGEQRDGSRYPYGSRQTTAALGRQVDRLTAKDWDTALKLAFEARAFFQRAAELRSEEAAETGLDLLFQSLRAWPSQEGFRLLLPPTVETLASTCLQRRRQRFVPDPDPNWRPQFPGVFPQSAPASEVLPTNQAMRAQVVEKFWRRLPSTLRTLFEPVVLYKGESYTTLANFAHSDPILYRSSLEKRGSQGMADMMITALQLSKDDWGVVI